MVRKQQIAIGINKIVKSIVKLSVFRNFLAKIVTFFSENETFRSQHKSCVSYYDDVINHDVT